MKHVVWGIINLAWFIFTVWGWGTVFRVYREFKCTKKEHVYCRPYFFIICFLPTFLLVLWVSFQISNKIPHLLGL